MNIRLFGHKVAGFVSKNSPMILSIIGIGAVMTGTVIIVNKARNANKPLDDGRTFEEKIADSIDEARYEASECEDKKTGRKVLVKAYAGAAFKYTKYYAAPVLLISGGVGCLFSAMLIQTKRLRVISAAYTALAAAFNDYRDRVKAVVGEEKEEDIFKGIERDEKGNIISENPLDEKYSENTKKFSRLFGDGNSVFWSKETRLCVLTLKGAESTLNQLLRYQGFVTLNDVWKELGMKPSEEGMYLGWRWKYGDPIYGETYIDLGFSGPKNEERCEILRNSYNEEIWIDLIPPHTLFGKLPKEIIRSRDEKDRIRANRRKVKCYE